MAQTTREQMISEKVAPVLVARTLGPFDLVVIFVAIVLFINNAAGLQFAGPSVFIFWIVAFADVPDHRGVRDGPARAHVPRGGLALRLDPQGARPVLGVLRRVRGVVARPDLAGVHRDPVRELPAAGCRVHQAELRVPVPLHRELADRRRRPGRDLVQRARCPI